METSMLISTFREKVSKMKDERMKEGQVAVGYPTGFLNFDFINGTKMFGKRENTQLQYYSVGITDGSMNMFIGRSGCGKTTYTIQIAGNIIRPFPAGSIFHDDIEGGSTSPSRRSALTKIPIDKLKDRYVYRNSGITCENFYERIKMIHDMKIENASAYEYDTGLYDSYGEKIIKMQPTVYILDSLAMMMPDKYSDEDELSGQMAQTATARVNASIFRRIVPMLKTANIILLVINHITEKIEGMVHTQSQVSYLKQGETLPGGRNPVYVANNLIRMSDREKLTPDKAFGINGTLVEVELVKSRSNTSGQKCVLVFDKDNGFDEELSMFMMLKNAGKINGAGIGLYLRDRNDMKFSQKTFKTKIHENEELMNVFMEECMEVLKTLVPDTVTENVEKAEQTDKFTTSLLDRMNNLMVA